MASILANDTFKCMFLNENVLVSIKISLQFVPKSLIDTKAAFVQVKTPDRRQVITWTNAYLVRWTIYAALVGDKLFVVEKTLK